MMHWTLRTVVIGLVAGLVIANPTRTIHAQDTTSTSSTAPPAVEPASPDSPRASVTEFLKLTRAGDYAAASRYLQLGPNPEDPARQARRLKAVLDRYLWIDLDALSPKPEGNTDDGLPRRTDQIGTIQGPTGKEEPVRIVRREDKEGVTWVFSAATVGRIDAWYDTLGNQWVFENLPDALMRPGPRDLLWWQWLALPIVLLGSWLVGYVLARVTRAFLMRLAARTQTPGDDRVVERLGGPLTVAWMLAVARLLIPWLELYQPAEEFIDNLLGTGFILVFFWSLFRTIDIVSRVVLLSSWAVTHPASRSLVPLGSRVAKAALAVVAAVTLMSGLGFPVASLLAGLGIGGLALALAAQKTVENLFGSFSIGVDQPFREGDFVKIEDFVGTVERIGLRSTRFRTLDRTLITIPNGKLADSRLESFTARDRIRLFTVIGLVYGTTAEQMKTVLDGFESTLRNHPKIWKDSITVRFEEFAAYSLNVKVMAWFETPDFNEFQELRQGVLLDFMAIVEKSGSDFAFPTQTIHVQNASA